MFADGKFHVIPSVRDVKNLGRALEGAEEYVLLSSCVHIGNLKELTKICHSKGKKVIVNHEIVGGLGADRIAFQMLRKMYMVDAVMGAGASKLGMLKKEGMGTIRRVALEDSLAVKQVMDSLEDIKCDAIELRPGYYAAKFIKDFRKIKDCPYIAGGFIDSVEMTDTLYESGFSGITTSCTELWGYQPEIKKGKRYDKKYSD